MARLTRLCPLGIPQHVAQRGNNRQPCFASDEDMAAYAHWLAEAAIRYGVDIHAWVFMTNHIHLLATPRNDFAVSKMMQFVGRHYVRYFNHTYQRTGTLWEGRFKSCLVQEDEYLFYCYRYIELNPVRANMVSHLSLYVWSSYRSNGMGVNSQLRTPHPQYVALGKTDEERASRYRSLFDAHLDGDIAKEISKTTQQGLVLGNDVFKDAVEHLVGRRVRAVKPGPKIKIDK